MLEIREPLHIVLPILPDSALRKENSTLSVATTRGNAHIHSTAPILRTRQEQRPNNKSLSHRSTRLHSK
jgi:hypothetical protein